MAKSPGARGWITVEAYDVGGRKKRLTDDLREIHEGEAAAMVLALDKGLPILIDESSGRAVAEALGLAPRGTLYVALKARAIQGKLQAVRERVGEVVSRVGSKGELFPNKEIREHLGLKPNTMLSNV